MTEIYSPFISDIERQKLEVFNADPIMKEAVKKILLKGIYENGTLRAGIQTEPLKNFALSLAFTPGVSNEELGSDLRARAAGIAALESAFTKIGEYKQSPPDNGEEINKAL